MTTDQHVLVIGAGPAGLTASYLLSKAGVPVTVLEMDPIHVGGIARTVDHQGYLFDIGPHRFFSKAREVEDLWTEVLGDELLQCPRLTRIFYDGKFFHYPLRPVEALLTLGFFRSFLCGLSYLKAQVLPHRQPRNFEEWVTNQFGQRLFDIFFKTYTEKVWGMPCKEISADWAAQRIKGFSLGAAIWNGLWPKRQPKDRGEVIKTIIDSFRYPRRGAGQMWEAFARLTREQGGEVLLGREVVSLVHDAEEGVWTLTARDPQGQEHEVRGTQVISSAPLSFLARTLTPALSPAAQESCGRLRYRDYLAVILIGRDRGRVPDHWIYVHEPSVKVGRIVNYHSFSEEMVPGPGKIAYEMEYFCFEGDEFWEMSEQELIAFATEEIERTGLVEAGDIEDGCVVRQAKAYPVYDDEYAGHVATLRDELGQRFPTLQQVGRNGMHMYNNQDHAMMTAMLTVENIVAGVRRFDPWQVNQDAEYHESGDLGGSDLSREGGRATPKRVGG